MISRKEDRTSERSRVSLILFYAAIALILVQGAAQGQENEATGGSFIVKAPAYSIVVKESGIVETSITLRNTLPQQQRFIITPDGDGSQLVEFEEDEWTLEGSEEKAIPMKVYGLNSTGEYPLSIIVRGNRELQQLRMNITIREDAFKPVNALLIELKPAEDRFYRGRSIRYAVDVNKLLQDMDFNVSITSKLEGENETLILNESAFSVETSFTKIFEINLPENMTLGEYVLELEARYLEYSSTASTRILITEPFYNRTVFGMPLWGYATGLAGTILLILLVVYIRKKQESKKRFHAKIDLKTLPKPGPRTLYTGKIAETTTKTYLDMDTLTTHIIIAGSTGGGKTIAAQDIIEETLEKNISVAVFDPTAQWTGMLRPLKDKKMLSLYPQYGMNTKKTPKAYPGNITHITNPYTKINLTQKLTPGQIHIFTLNKLDPKDIDTFVANTIREVFHQNLQEQRQLTTLLVYDEVHRLLPKFGGSGEGFIQIERGCREFRKWGIGIMLVSQVLADFVGQIKANINTEIQMKTRDEGDLERIKTKFGTQYIQSLVKAPVGSGMIQNSQYNHGKPYYITFRPIKHSIARLTDQELEQYNTANQKIDQLQYELEQLKQHGTDTFDMQLELNLAKQKIQTGNFNIANIYTETLQQQTKQKFQQLKITPKKLQQQTINKKELQKEIQKAQQERQKTTTQKTTQEKKESKEKEPLFTKIVPLQDALTFNNGQTAMSLQELKDIIISMSPEIFAQHHTKEKNDTAEWISEKLKQKELADEIRGASSRKEVVTILAAWEKKNIMVGGDEQNEEAGWGEKEEEADQRPQEDTHSGKNNENGKDSESPAKSDEMSKLIEQVRKHIDSGSKKEALSAYENMRAAFARLDSAEKKTYHEDCKRLYESVSQMPD